MFACVVIDNMTVDVLDTHNPAQKYINEIDANVRSGGGGGGREEGGENFDIISLYHPLQDDLCVHATNMNNGRVSCL